MHRDHFPRLQVQDELVRVWAAVGPRERNLCEIQVGAREQSKGGVLQVTQVVDGRGRRVRARRRVIVGGSIPGPMKMRELAVVVVGVPVPDVNIGSVAIAVAHRGWLIVAPLALFRTRTFQICMRK